MKVGEQRLAALARPLDRATDAPGGPRHQRELRIERVAGAVVAADLARNDADGAARHAQRFRQVVLDALAAARAGIERVMIALRVVHGERRARLQRDAGDPVHAGLEPDHVGGAGERGVGGGRIAAVGVDAHVGAGLLPDERRAGGRRLGGADHDRQRLVLHPHRLGAVAGGRRRLGDDHGHRLAHEPHAVGGQRRVRGDEVLRAVAVRELRLVRVGRNGAVRNRLEPVGGRVGPGEHGKHARRLERGGGVDADDARVGVRRADEARVRLPRRVEVVAVPAAADDQPRVFYAAHGFAEALARRAGTRRQKRHRYSANWAARQRRAAPSPSFSRISSNFVPTSVRAA